MTQILGTVTKNGAEPGPGYKAICLYEGTGIVADTVSVNNDGTYAITGLTPGAYAVVILDTSGAYRSKVIHTIVPGCVPYTIPAATGAIFNITEVEAVLVATGNTLHVCNEITNPPVEQDPYWSNVVSLLHFDFDWTDVKGRTWTAGSGSSVSTTQFKFGGGAANDVYVAIPYNADFSFGSGDFTVEFWHNWASSAADFQTAYNHGYNGAGGLLMQTVASGSGADSRRFHVLVNGSILFTEATAPNALTWVHYALVRSSGVVTLYRNGVSTGSGTSSALLNNTNAIAFGARQTINPGQYQIRGYTDDLRITKGIARYTATFTPPIRAFPNS